MLSLQQANEFLQGSPFSDMRLQQALIEDGTSAGKLRELVLELYGKFGERDSLLNLLTGIDSEHKGYALSIIANFLIYGENDILFIKTAQELLDVYQRPLKNPA